MRARTAEFARLETAGQPSGGIYNVAGRKRGDSGHLPRLHVYSEGLHSPMRGHCCGQMMRRAVVEMSRRQSSSQPCCVFDRSRRMN